MSKRARYGERDIVTARGVEWRVIDRSDDEAESVWAVRIDNPDADAILRYAEITDMDPREAIERICHTSKRGLEGKTYTCKDDRYPDYAGRQIREYLDHGTVKVEWIR